MNYTQIGGGVTAPLGFLAGAAYAGVKNPNKKSEKPDVAVLYSETPCACAACFTRNKFCAAPVLLGREVLKKGKARAIVINSGNANAATGEQGIKDAKAVEEAAEKLLGLGEDEVFVCSTGVIGKRLPYERVIRGVEQIVPNMGREKGTDAAWAIMTTDTVRKESAYELKLSGGTVRIGAMAKGSGMIHPNMATMLAYVTTDAKVAAADLQQMLSRAVDISFNMTTVDGDTSTNDSIFLLANGASGVEITSEEDKAALAGLVEHICLDMTKRIASDGEGATHLIEVQAYGLPTEHDARLVAKSIAGSSLFKAAVFGRDANWGRIMAAAGYSGADVDPANADCFLESAAGKIQVMKGGFGLDFDEDLAKKILSEHDITVIVRFYQGNGEAKAWGCDLTYDYVRINGDYRT
ncbi:MAG: bifunctional glutamate N-acetyltransferase/amino-acid acetyltransferase ArgJ [Lachnospiraceae bacterium]|nr:bifunctional glutamate N-acetyltransferase/amino-acid acetyltransferase ArgJ [Lachnospiraceae bacterium]